eukprot:3053024-Alexandrium_andersonii.AAC.1
MAEAWAAAVAVIAQLADSDTTLVVDNMPVVQVVRRLLRGRPPQRDRNGLWGQVRAALAARRC